jgi:flagellar biosynthesis protein FliR
MLASLVTAEIGALFLVFCRLGSALMMMPGFGDAVVPPRIRLLLAIGITLAVTPVVAAGIPALPDEPARMLMLVAGEVAIGLFIGLVARVAMAALQAAGSIIALQASLANAFVFDAVSAQQTELVGQFLMLAGLLVIFTSDLHHVMLSGMVESYGLFAAGNLPAMGDLADTMARLTAQSFRVALQISAPFVVMGVVFTVGLGLLARLMPQLQVFFIAIPIQVAIAVALLAATMSVGMEGFLASFEEMIRLGPGDR